MKKSKRSIAIVMIFLTAILLAGTIVICGKMKQKNQKFTSATWKDCKEEKRYQYIESLEKQYTVVGMGRKNVEELLGSPSAVEQEHSQIHAYEYRISDDALAGWKVYRIAFESDIVTHVETVSEDW